VYVSRVLEDSKEEEARCNRLQDNQTVKRERAETVEYTEYSRDPMLVNYDYKAFIPSN
jgi:hypothetical protein